MAIIIGKVEKKRNGPVERPKTGMASALAGFGAAGPCVVGIGVGLWAQYI